MNTKLAVEERLELYKLKPKIAVQLHELKMQVDNLKNTLHDEYMRYLKLQSLDTWSKSDGIPDITDTPTEEEICSIQKIMAEMKTEIDKSESNIQDITNKIENVFQEYKATVSCLENLSVEYKSKQEELSMPILEDGSTNTLESLQMKRAAIKEAKADFDTELKATDLEIQLMEIALQAKKKPEGVINIEMPHCRREKFEEFCRKLISVTEAFTGVRDKGLDGDVWCVSNKATESETPDMELKVRMILDWHYDKPILRSAEVDNMDIDLSGVTKRAVELNNIGFLLANLQKVWLSHYLFLSELKKLRKCYALDWDHLSNTLKVIYGKRADIVCELNIRPNYPGDGAVTLETVRGQGQIDMENLKLSQEDATVTQWLEHLHRKLDGNQ